MSLSETKDLAGIFVKSGFFKDAQDAAKAVVKILAGREVGFGPIASMTNIYIVQGKVSLGANLIAALVKRDPRYDYRIKTCDLEGCTLEWYDNKSLVGESSFTAEEAKTTNYFDNKTKQWKSLASKVNYQNYPTDMYFARAVTRGARRFAPDIIGGSAIYTPEELDEDYNTIEGKATVMEKLPEPMLEQQSGNQPSVQQPTPRIIESDAIFGPEEEPQEKTPEPEPTSPTSVQKTETDIASDKTKWEGVFDFPLEEYSDLPRGRQLGALSQATEKVMARNKTRGWLQEQFGNDIVGFSQLSDEQLVKAFQLLTE